MHELTAPPSFFNEKFFNDLYKLAELNNFTAEELRNYMKRLFAVSDYENTIEFAKAESKAEGRAEGRAEERAENRAFLTQSLRRMLPLFYPECATAETLERIENIEETERLQELINAMLEQMSFERIAELL